MKKAINEAFETFRARGRAAGAALGRAVRERDRRLILASAVVLAVVVGAVIPWGGAMPSIPRSIEPNAFTVLPKGDDVPTLAPVKVTFKSAPTERDGSKLLTLEPAAPGDYAWVGDRTLLFQPRFPGLLRGTQYTVTVAAAPDAALAQPFITQFTTTGALTVQTVIPADGDTEVPSGAQVLAQFSRSVAPLTLLREMSSAPVIEFDPPLPGKGEWLNTSLYRFIPDAVPPVTTYKARIRAGLTSAADGVLKQDFAWTFTTYSPALTSVYPEDQTQYASLRQQVVLRFNLPMDKASVARGVQVRDPAGKTVPGTFAWSEKDTVATFAPSVTLSRATTYRLDVAAALRSVAGGLTRVGRSSTFITLGPPRVQSTSPENGNKAAARYGVSITFSNPMNTKSIAGKVSISGVDMSKVESSWYSDDRTVYFSAVLKPRTSYTVKIAAGVTDRDGGPLDPYEFSFTTGAPDSYATLFVPYRIGTYSATVEPVVYFRATNVAQVQFRLYPLTTSEKTSILSADGWPYLPPPQMWTPSSQPVRTWSQPVRAQEDAVIVGSTSLSGGGPLAKGDYFLRLGNGGYGNDLAFSVVDSVIVAKVSHNELVAWALDLNSGQPLRGVRVGASGPGLASGAAGVSDANGLVSFSLPDISTTSDAVRQYVVSIDDGGRKGVATTYWNQGAQPYQLGIESQYGAPAYVGQLYTDRPLYRPGETVFYKAIIRADDDAVYTIPPRDLPLVAVIRDSQGKELSREKVALNALGTYGASFRLPDSAGIGDYFIRLVLETGPEWRRDITGATFTVAEFRKPEFQVDVAADRAAYVAGDTITANLTATFFFGGPLEGATTDWTVTSDTSGLFVPGYDAFSFSDYDYFFQPSVSEDRVRARGQTVTKSGGQTKFSVPATVGADGRARVYTLSATVTDQNAQAVSASASVTVHPADFYAGIKPADYVAEAGRDERFDLVTVDIDGKPLARRAVTVRVYDRTWVTTKEDTADGRSYHTEPVDRLVATLNTTTNDKGEGSVVYRPDNAGTLRVVAEVTDAKGRRARSAAYVWVSGGAYASWPVTNNDAIKLVADKSRYEVGDTATVLVPAPYAGMTGLVTVERGKIMTRSTQTFATNSERLSIPIVDRDVPNVYVSVVLYRAPTPTDPIPRYKLGYVELPVSTATRKLSVAIKADREQTKPGDKVKYEIRVTNAAGKGVRSEIAVDVSDKALLSLVDDTSTTGLQAFWYRRGLGVMTSSSIAVSINRANDAIADALSSKGGGVGGGVGTERLRQDFRNSAYWEAQVTTNDDGVATIEVSMPDNLTTWRLRARAISGDTMVGEATHEIVSTQPLLLRPALPRFLRVGDKTTIRALVRNGTRGDLDLAVTLGVEGIEVSGGLDRSGKVAPNQSVLFEWPASVSAPGTAKFTFRASAGGLADAVQQSIPIRLDVTPETTATGGVVTDETQSEALYLPSYANPSRGALDVAVQPSLTGSLSGELGEFARRDWETYEDTVKVASRTLAWIGVRRADPSAAAAANAQLQTDVATLLTRPNSDGGWSWCIPGYCSSDPEVTALVLMALGEARRDGISVDAGVLNNGVGWVTAYLSRLTDVERPADLQQRALLLYASAIAGQADAVVPQIRATLEQHGSRLANASRAYLLLGLAEGQQTKADSYVSRLLNDLVVGVIPSANGNHWEDAKAERWTHTSTRTTALVLEALVRLDPTHPLIEETVRWLMVARGAEGWSAYAERAQAILSLSDFAAKTGELGGDYDYAVVLGDRNVLGGHFKPGDGKKTDATTLPLSDIRPGTISLLSFARQRTAGRMYYTLNLHYQTPAQNIEALNRGIAVTHEYTRLDDPKTRVFGAKLGDTIRVKVTVVAPADLNYVEVDDFLPAGLEPIDPRLNIVDPNLKERLNAERVRLLQPGGVVFWAPWFEWYYSPWDGSEIRDDHVTLRAQQLPKGIHEYVYYARATSPGDYYVAPSHAQESFFPEVFGRSDSARFAIQP